MSHPRDEVQAAVDAYVELRGRIEAGEATWTDLADIFTDDLVYIDPAWGRIEGIDSAAREHIGSGQKARVGRAAGHQNFEHGVAVVCRRISHQQDRRGRACLDGLVVGMELLIESRHDCIMCIRASSC